MTWFGVACELHRDWRNDIEGLAALCSNHIPDYRNLMTSYNAFNANSRSRGHPQPVPRRAAHLSNPAPVGRCTVAVGKLTQGTPMNTALQDNREVVTVCLQHQVLDSVGYLGRATAALEAGAANLPGDLPDDHGRAATAGAAVCPLPATGGAITGNLIVNLFVILPVVFYIMPW